MFCVALCQCASLVAAASFASYLRAPNAQRHVQRGSAQRRLAICQLQSSTCRVRQHTPALCGVWAETPCSHVLLGSQHSALSALQAHSDCPTLGLLNCLQSSWVRSCCRVLCLCCAGGVHRCRCMRALWTRAWRQQRDGAGGYAAQAAVYGMRSAAGLRAQHPGAHITMLRGNCARPGWLLR